MVQRGQRIAQLAVPMSEVDITPEIASPVGGDLVHNLTEQIVGICPVGQRQDDVQERPRTRDRTRSSEPFILPDAQQHVRGRAVSGDYHGLVIGDPLSAGGGSLELSGCQGEHDGPRLGWSWNYIPRMARGYASYPPYRNRTGHRSP